MFNSDAIYITKFVDFANFFECYDTNYVMIEFLNRSHKKSCVCLVEDIQADEVRK